jgi:hypothetical protein
MVRRKLWNAAGIAAAVLPLVLLSCSDDNNNNGASGGSGGSGGSAGTGGNSGSGGTSSDGGKSDGGTSDAPGSTDAGTDRISDAGATLPDGAVPPSGTRLVPGSVTLLGVTSDNYAVYTDDTAGTLNVISLDGGTPTSIGSADDMVVVRGSVVLWWAGTARVSLLSVWTASGGSKVLGMTTYANAAGVAVSPDNSKVLYFDGVDTGRISGNLFIAGSNGATPTRLATSIALSNPACAPVLAFGGSTAAAAAYCAAIVTIDAGTIEGGTIDAGSSDATTSDSATPDATSPDATSPDATRSAATRSAATSAPVAIVQSYSGATWMATTIASGVEPRVAISPNGATVLVSAPAGLLAYPTAGGTATTIDAAGGTGAFTSDSLSVIYTTPANALKRSTVASPNPTTLAATGFAGIRATSPDDKWILGYTTIDTRNDVSDLFLTSATAAAAPTTLSTATTAGLFGFEGFTDDSSHATYYTDIANGVGIFKSITSAGGTPITLGSNVWLHHAAKGSKVAFSDNYSDVDNSADIHVADTSQSGPPALVVSLADADFYVAGSKDKVVYAWKYLSGSMAGLWVTALP